VLDAAIQILGAAIDAGIAPFARLFSTNAYLYLPIYLTLTAAWWTGSKLYVSRGIRRLLENALGCDIELESVSGLSYGAYGYRWSVPDGNWAQGLVVWVALTLYQVGYQLPVAGFASLGIWVWLDPRAGDFTAAAHERLQFDYLEQAGAEALADVYRAAVAWAQKPFGVEDTALTLLVFFVSLVVFAALLGSLIQHLPGLIHRAMQKLSGVKLDRTFGEFINYEPGDGSFHQGCARFLYSWQEAVHPIFWFIAFGEFVRFWSVVAASGPF
jgi:hypothetical protein